MICEDIEEISSVLKYSSFHSDFPCFVGVEELLGGVRVSVGDIEL